MLPEIIYKQNNCCIAIVKCFFYIFRCIFLLKKALFRYGTVRTIIVKLNRKTVCTQVYQHFGGSA